MLENFVMVAQNVIGLFVLIAIGFICGKKGVLTEESSKKMTDIVLYVVTPCVMVWSFQGHRFSKELLFNIFITALCAAASIIATIFISKLVFHDKNEARKKVLQFSSIFSNCGFMSLPLQRVILGNEGLFYGSIFVAVFNIIVWTYGLVMMSGDKKQMSVKKLAVNPGIIGVVAAMILFVLSRWAPVTVDLPGLIIQPIGYLADLNTPLPMLIIGYYLSNADLKKAFTDAGAYLAIIIRLVAVPLMTMIAMYLLRVDTTIMIACVIASSAPTAATTTMFAAKFNRDVELSVSIVASTTLVSVITMPFIVALAQSI